MTNQGILVMPIKEPIAFNRKSLSIPSIVVKDLILETKSQTTK